MNVFLITLNSTRRSSNRINDLACVACCSKVKIFGFHSWTCVFALRQQEGRALLEECLLISERFNGKEHPSLVPHLVNLANSYSRSKNFAEAERLLRISLQILGKNAPPDDPSITFPMLNLAVVLFNLHRDEEAERLAVDVLNFREKAFGKESIPVGKCINLHSADWLCLFLLSPLTRYNFITWSLLVSFLDREWFCFCHFCSVHLCCRWGSGLFGVYSIPTS